MPYKIEKDTKACSVSKPYAVKKKDDGKVMGCHPTREKAKRQIAAIEANENRRVLDRIRKRG